MADNEAQTKAKAYGALDFKGRDFIKVNGPYRLTVLSGPVYVELPDGGSYAELVIELSRGNPNVALPFSNPLRLVNPPLLVPDPNGDVIVDGKPHRRDITAALESVLRDLIPDN